MGILFLLLMELERSTAETSELDWTALVTAVSHQACGEKRLLPGQGLKDVGLGHQLPRLRDVWSVQTSLCVHGGASRGTAVRERATLIVGSSNGRWKKAVCAKCAGLSV